MTIALIDADVLVYECSWRAQETIDWGDEQLTSTADLKAAKADLDAAVADIMAAVGADRAILALTDSDRAANFRRGLLDSYKAHRETPGSHRPLAYRGLRAHVRATYEHRTTRGVEADDTLGILATVAQVKGLRLPPVEERVICSIDKDLMTVPGRHYNWRKPELGVREVTEEEADREHMLHTLIGDRTDGYPGAPGIGKVRAERVLAVASDQWWRAVVASFKGDEEAALANARCARILRADDFDFATRLPILWTPPKGD
ncbi:MAG: exonuclease [Gammaproteobacteria bacterium]|nr:exonuclease [Gemmatimonadota bacterium]NIR35065.1 exonuclease [Actinomycetota bacterium]NIU76091.1 exonuclease [Gammaproteobacteria bacterium]NIY09942.1 exonuclease [Gemmatimonadota bacterium]